VGCQMCAVLHIFAVAGLARSIKSHDLSYEKTPQNRAGLGVF
jgi:hypothetical protein